MTIERDNELLRLRPIIEAKVEDNPKNSPGHFQNVTLRPILKLQNELLLQIFRQYVQKRKSDFFQLPLQKRSDYISNSVRSDMRLRNLLTGVIIGQFTVEEWEVFAPQEQELTRRIADMLIERLNDQVDDMVE